MVLTMFTDFNMDGATILAAMLLGCMFIWNVYLIFDQRQRADPPSLLSSLALLCHTIPAAVFCATTIISHAVDDQALVWFVALMVFRYWRTVVNIFFWFRYVPALPTDHDKITPYDCTVIVPTVGLNGNIVFRDMIAGVLSNRPSRMIFSTNTDLAQKQINAFLPTLIKDFEAGNTSYQREWGMKGMAVTTVIEVTNSAVSNKRQQVVNAFSSVNTKIVIMIDDTSIWHPLFLAATLPAFNNDKVGLVGTRKWVKRLSYVPDPTASTLKNLWLRYFTGFWNTMGGLYLVRHNFEIRATNAADGGVFCVSGRTSLIRTEIVNNHQFAREFLNEYVLRLGNWFPGWGPVTADDDNFITRHVINNGWGVKIQYSEKATMTTILGQFPLKFPDQCRRWSRTTFRQNPIALFVDRTIWWKWPLTVWTTYFPWMYNAALIWDGLAVYTLRQTKLYAEAAHPMSMLASLIICIWLSKLVKTIPWFWQHPMDFLLYFLIPAYPLFAYYHSLLKIWTAFTFWDLTWSGRKLPKAD